MPFADDSSVARTPYGTLLPAAISMLILALAGVAFFRGILIEGTASFFLYIDGWEQSFPWLYKVCHSWGRYHRPPLWDFTSYSGISFIGELQTAPLYPPTILLGMLFPEPSQRILEWYIFFHFLIAAGGMLAFLRGRALGWPAAVAGAFLFAYVGAMPGRAVAQTNIFMGMVWLPWILMAFDYCLDRGGRRYPHPLWSMAAGGFLALSFLAGHNQPFVHSALALLIYALFRCRWERATVVRAALALIFVALAATLFVLPQLLLTYEYMLRSYRWVGTENPLRGTERVPFSIFAYLQILNPQDLSKLFFPVLWDELDTSPFATRTALLLAVAGCWMASPRLRRLVGFAVLLGSLGLLLSMGHHTPLGLIAYFTPFLNTSRCAIRALYLFHFAIPVLAALGLDSLFSGRKRPPWTAARIVLGALCCAMLVLEAFSMQKRYNLASNTESALSVEHYFNRQSRMLALLQAADLREQGGYRILIPDIRFVPLNWGHINGLKAVFGYRSGMLISFFEYFSRDWDYTSPLYDRLAARYFLSDKPLAGSPYKLLLEENGIWLYERPNALPIFQELLVDGSYQPFPVEKVSWEPDAVTLQLAAHDASSLVMAQPFFPGWQASADGQPLPVIQVDIFTGVMLKGTERQVTFRYAPWQWRYSWWVPLAVPLVAMVIYISGCRRKAMQDLHPALSDDR